MMTTDGQVLGWEAYFTEIHSFLRHIELRVEDSRQDQLEYCLERLETIISSTARIRDALSRAQNDEILQYYTTSLDELLLILNEVHSYIDSHLDNVLSASCTSYSSSSIRTGRRGRPKFDISVDQLAYLASFSFSWTSIAKMLGISRMTLYRRRVAFGMEHRGVRIQYNELLVLLRRMKLEFPEMGEVMVLGRLRALGYSVSRDKVRTAIREIDPINTALRGTTGPLARRVYSVPGPNSLWHMGKWGEKELLAGVEEPECYLCCVRAI